MPFPLLISVLRRRHSGLRAPLALVIALAMWLGACQGNEDSPTEGKATLSWYVVDRTRTVRGTADRLVKQNDQIQFRYQAGGRRSLVLVSIDGEGNFTTLHPRRGEKPVPITPFGEHPLQQNLILDIAPSPEVYVASFDPETVEKGVVELQAAWAKGGLLALKKLANERDDIALVVLLRGD